MDVSFETRLPMASLLRDAREFFGARHGLTARDEGDGVITFSGASGAVRLAAAAASAGAVRVEVNTEALGALVADFRARVAPPPGAFPRRRRL
ncbi:MAG: hypothetical protein FJZ92_13845, partial [Chloroflexi bacterium]|nr:hypothetical protein [Chloroflexota bacterium]